MAKNLAYGLVLVVTTGPGDAKVGLKLSRLCGYKALN